MMGRPPCCDKANVKRGLWTPEEDAKLLAYVANHGIGNWTLVPKVAGLSRCGKSCRLRWTNYLRPDLKHDNFTPEEEQLILDYHKAFGSRWSFIAQQLPGRTDNDVKNYWNTKLKKKLTKMGIDPITHKPISQILCDYEKISSLQNTARNQNLSQTPTPTLVNNNNSIQYQFSALSLSEVPMPPHDSFMQPLGSDTLPLNAAEFLLENCGWDTKETLVPPPVAPYVPMMNVQDGTEFDQYEVREGCSEVVANLSYGNSFVAEILDKDSEMKSEFPEFLNQYFNY